MLVTGEAPSYEIEDKNLFDPYAIALKDTEVIRPVPCKIYLQHAS